MMTSRSTRFLVAAIFLTALTFTSIVPIVNAGPDVYRKIRSITQVYSNSTGAFCYTETRDYPRRPDTNTTHFKQYHKNKTTSHTHINTTYVVEHNYTEYRDCY